MVSVAPSAGGVAGGTVVTVSGVFEVEGMFCQFEGPASGPIVQVKPSPLPPNPETSTRKQVKSLPLQVPATRDDVVFDLCH